MADGVDGAAGAFARAIDPGSTGAQPARDQSGRFAQVSERPEPLFQVRMVEGDDDGGSDPQLETREREVQDGVRPRQDRQAQPQSREEAAEAEGEDSERRGAAEGEERDGASADDGHAGTEDESEDDEGLSYEITVDGAPQRVSFGELRDGYIRTATFHQRLNKINEHRNHLAQEEARTNALRDHFITGLKYLDEEVSGLMPKEPNWDEEFARDPQAAHAKQKQFQAYYGKLNQIRQNRAWAIQNAKEETDRQSARFAVEQFSDFVQEHPNLFKDQAAIERIVGGMRKLLLGENFVEQEVAGVYDKRMLNVVLKAYLYDRGTAVRPQAALPGPGKTLVPGSARPLGSAGRRNIDEAQRQLARSGRLEDAETVFERLLR